MLAHLGVLLCLAALSHAQSCGGVLSVNGGTFSSPNYPSNYPNNAECIWTLEAGSNTYILTFEDEFEIESLSQCRYDSLEVKRGNTVLATLCGTEAPQPLELTGSITITFSSDSSVRKKGFRASYVAGTPSTGTTPANPATTTPPVAGCGGNFEGESGIIQSPNHPNNYDNNLDCTYTVTIPEGKLALKFLAFDVESSSTCQYDYLEIQDNGASKKLCGASASTYKASSNTVTMRFVTDSSVQKTGWKIEFERLTCSYECVAEADCTGQAVNEYCAAAGTVCCVPDLSAEGCGVRRESRIVGGNHASKHEWPWQASLQTTSSSFHFCGATLINNYWAMTAAHCVDGSSTSSMKVVLGEHHVTEAGHEDAPPVTKLLSKVFMHPNYDGNGNGFPNDIALVKFTEPVTFTNEIIPACLPPADMIIAGSDNCWISGWGNTQDPNHESEILNELKVDVLTNEVCSGKWGSSYINSGHVCLNNGLSGACNGDSGGPLSCKGNDGKWYVNGATSWGRSGCQTEGYPSVYSRVTFFLDWINDILTNQ